MVTTELTLLLAVYAGCIIVLFLGNGGMKDNFKDNLPKLSLRIERNVITGYGFMEKPSGHEVRWKAPP